MHRAVIVLALALAFTLPAGATPPAVDLLASQQPGVDGHSDLARDLLFVELGTPAVGEPLSLDVAYHINGTLAFAETLDAVVLEGQAEDRPTVVELLAWHPEVRSRLISAANRGAEVSVDVTRDGATSHFAMASVLERTHELQEMGPVFAKNRSQTTAPAASAPLFDPGPQSVFGQDKDPGCVNQCWAEYDWCEDNCWNYGGGAEDCFARCDAEFNSCYNGCPETCTGPTTRDYSDTVIAGFQYTGPSRCLTWLLYNYYFDYGLLTLKTTTYRETTYCDGTKTTVVLSVAYTSYYCWLRSYQGCSYPVGDSLYYFTCPA